MTRQTLLLSLPVPLLLLILGSFLPLGVAFVGEPQEFMERAERAKGALALKHAEWLHSQERSQENSSGSFHILPQAPFLDEMLFPGDLGIISEVLSAL